MESGGFGTDSDIVGRWACRRIVCVMLLARAIRRAGCGRCWQPSAAQPPSHRYGSPQGPIWVDPDNNHCFLTPRLARSAPSCQFKVFWQADTPERPDPYLSNFDPASVGAKPGKEDDVVMKRPNHLRVIK